MDYGYYFPQSFIFAFLFHGLPMVRRLLDTLSGEARTVSVSGSSLMLYYVTRNFHKEVFP